MNLPNAGGRHAEGSRYKLPSTGAQGKHSMSNTRPGYFRLPAAELGADLIFVPTYTRGLSVMELALWAKEHGFGQVAYIPGKSKPDTGVEA